MEVVAITGADGFIGKNLASHFLDLGIEVYAIGINESRLSDLRCPKLHFIKAYFEDYDNLDKLLPIGKIDVFYHFAWNGVFGESFKDYKLQLLNTQYACVALSKAINLKCKKFVLASTKIGRAHV